MSSPDKELEQQLMEAGNRLMDPSSSVEELLPLLDEVENCLSRVEQSPSQSMQNALSPSLKALVTEQIFRHSDADVKVAVASCISEITRITAPDAPYDDDQMKDAFQLIVSSFENLFDKSSRSYAKRTSILETVAKVRSCVVMLDLECDALIIEMFQHFLKAIRDYHPENVFSSMETIMTLVLEESEDVSMELLSPLLACVKRDNEEVMPVARKLAERVLETCGNKLKPCFTEAVKTLGISLDDYSKVVASICQDLTNLIKQDDGAIDNQLANENKPNRASLDDVVQDQKINPGEVGPAEEVDVANDKPSKAVESNGIMQEGNPLLDSSSLKKQEHGTEELSIATRTAHQSDNLSSENLINSEKAKNDARKRKRKSASSKSREPFHCSSVDEKEAGSLSEQKSEKKHIPDLPQSDPSVTPALSLANEKATGDQSPSPKVTDGETDEVATLTPSSADENHLTKHGRTKKNEATIEAKASVDDASTKGVGGTSDSETNSNRRMRKKAAKIPYAVDKTKGESGGASELEAKLKSIKIQNEGTRDSESNSSRRSGKKAAAEVPSEEKTSSAEDEAKEGSGGASDSEAKRLMQPIMIQKEGTSDSEVKSSKHLGKKAVARVSSEDKIPFGADETKEESGASDLDARPLKQSIRKVESRKDNGDEFLPKHPADKKKRSRGKDIPDKAEQRSSEKIDVEEMVISPNSLKQNKDEPHLEETPKAISKRKVTGSREKASGSVEYDETLVGSKVKVWWPEDRMFYEGVIDSFDRMKKKHKVVYNDGDEEILNLRREKWQFVADENGSSELQQDEGTDRASLNASSEMPPKKKLKTAEQLTKQENMDASPKKGGGATASKSKGAATKSGRKSRDDTKSDSRSKGGSKSGGKLGNDFATPTQDRTPKTVSSKSVDSASKATGKSKNDDSDGPKSSKSKDGTGLQKSTKTKQVVSRSAKTKQESPKISSDGKGKVPQSGAKSSGNGANKLKSGSSKKIESVKDLSKAVGSKSKSGKKRQR